MAGSKEVRDPIDQANTWQGWRVEKTKKGWMLYPPDKSLSPVLIHATPSDHKAWKNTRALLKKRGAPI